jgi:WD40 repeat protein
MGYGALPPGAWACLGSPRFVTGSSAGPVAFSPDGKLLAAGAARDQGFGIHIWSLSTGQEVCCRKEVFGALGVRFSPDSKVLLWAEFSTIHICEVATGKERRFQAHEGLITGLVLSRDGKRIVSSSQDGTIRVLDFATGKVLGHIKCNASGISLAPDGRTLAAASGEVHLWDLPTGKLLRRVNKNRFRWGHGATDVRFSPDGKILAVVDGGHDLLLFDARMEKERRRFTDRESMRGWIVFSPDSKWLVTAGGGNKQPGPLWRGFIVELNLWEVTSGRLLRSFQGPMSPEAFSPDGKTLAVRDGENDVRLLDAATGREPPSFAGHAGPITGLVFVPDGRTLWSSGYDGTLRAWDAVRQAEWAVLSGHPKVKALALTPDGRTLVSGGSDGMLRLWDAASCRPVQALALLRGEVWCAVFSPDGKTLATGQVEQGAALRLWDWRSGKELQRRSEPDGVPRCIAFAPDGKTLVEDYLGNILLRVTATGKIRRQLHGTHCDWVNAVGFLPDGTLVSAGGGNGVTDRAVRLWDVLAKKRLHEFARVDRCGHTSLAVSPDGRLIAGSFDRTIQVWETCTRQRVAEFSGHRGHVSALAFHPDGRTLASGGADGAILFWDLTGRRRAGRLVVGPKPPGELERLWQELAGENVDQARRALWTLALAPARSVPLLQRKLAPVPGVSAAQMAQLIAALDAEDFTVREKATRALKKLGEVAGSALRRALETHPSLEVEARATRLLEALEVPRLPQAAIQTLRAVEVLERAGTEPARTVLRRLAGGAPEARLTREAAAALKRLAALAR